MKKQTIIEFILGHFRYNTMNSWNMSTAPAVNVKIHRQLHGETLDRAWEFLDNDEAMETFNSDCIMLFSDFKAKTGFDVGFNGRSGGYLVMYQMDRDGKTYPGRSVYAFDREELAAMKYDELKSIYDNITALDKLAVSVVDAFKNLVESFNIVEEEITVTRTVKVLKERE